jgi:DNA-binding MarR family transcriptional regulator
MGSPTLVRHLDRLEQDGNVRRTRDRSDRRITRISLTPKGRRRLEKLRAVMRVEDEAMRAALSPAEVRTLERALDKLNRYVASRSTPRDSEAR